MQQTVVLIIVGVFFLLLLSGGGIVLYLLKKDTNKKLQESSGPSVSANTTQAFLPFKDIVDSMIVMDNHEYRMIIECSSINYALKTEEEQNAVEMSFRRFLNSVKFPFAFYIQTREIDNKEIVASLQKDIDSVLKTFPQLREYSSVFTHELKHINERLQNTRFKKKYIIISYNEVKQMNQLNDKEKRDYAFEELYNRCKSVIGGLSNIGIKGHILDTSEVANVIYQSIHKEVGGIADEIKDGSYLSLVVKGNGFDSSHPSAKIDAIILEFKNKLNTEILADRQTPQNYKHIASYIADNAEKMRGYAGAFFREKQEGDTYE